MRTKTAAVSKLRSNHAARLEYRRDLATFPTFMRLNAELVACRT
jgi:hypothetical protein